MSLDEALTMISDLEKTIRKMATSAMNNGHYDEAIKLTEIAKALSVSMDNVRISKPVQTKGQTKRTRSRTTKEGYPKFERDGSYLVRVGWHGTRNIEYREKASKTLLDNVVDRLLATSPDGKPFTTSDEFYNISDDKGKSANRNKIALCLAWLRNEGLVLREGWSFHSSYTIPDPQGLKDKVEEKWQTLPARQKG